MYLLLPLLLVCFSGFSRQDEIEETTAATSDNADLADAIDERVPTTLEYASFVEDTTVAELPITPATPGLPTQPEQAGHQPPQQQLQFPAPYGRSRPISSRRRPRRQQHHGFFNDGRYRNPANNPNNPNSPYAFRGRPGQQQQQYYEPRYYDPYGQATQDAYYAYTGYYYNYPPPNYQPHSQQPFPPQPYPYPPQPFQPPAPTEQVPELYYLQSPDSPDGQYQYKKVSVQTDVRRRRRPQRQQPPAYSQQPSYPYAYNPYDPYRQAYYPPQDQAYQQYNYPPYQYQRPRGARSPRKLRSGIPPKPTPDPRAWVLTSSPNKLDLEDAPRPPHSDLQDAPPAPSNTSEHTTSDQPVTAGE